MTVLLTVYCIYLFQKKTIFTSPLDPWTLLWKVIQLLGSLEFSIIFNAIQDGFKSNVKISMATFFWCVQIGNVCRPSHRERHCAFIAPSGPHTWLLLIPYPLAGHVSPHTFIAFSHLLALFHVSSVVGSPSQLNIQEEWHKRLNG